MPTETHTDLGDGLGLPLAGIRKDMSDKYRLYAECRYAVADAMLRARGGAS